MTATAWVSLLAIVVGAVITLVVAYMQRKQMRQIELHRLDPTIPLVPPPHPVTHFFRTYGYYLAAAGYSLGLLVREMRQTTPITRWVVFYIALDMVGIVLNVTFGYATYMLERAFKVASRTMGALDKMTDAIIEIQKRGD